MSIGTRRLGILSIIVLVVLAGAGGWYYLERNKISTDDATVDGRIHKVASRVPGYVIDVKVHNNDRVKVGDVLLEIDPVDYKLALTKAKAELASTHAGASSADSVLGEAEAEHRLAMLQLKRMKALFASGAVAKATYDEAVAKAKVTLGKVRDARAQLKALSDDQVKGQRSLLQARLAAVEKARRDLEHCKVRAPVSGFVAQRAVDIGTFVGQGQPLMTVVPLSPTHIWITANYKETDLARIKPGQSVSIEVDAYPGHIYTGKVASVQAGTGAAFSLFPSENAMGNYVKILQRVPVRINLDSYDPDKHPLLRLGLNVVPTIMVK